MSDLGSVERLLHGNGNAPQNNLQQNAEPNRQPNKQQWESAVAEQRSLANYLTTQSKVEVAK